VDANLPVGRDDKTTQPRFDLVRPKQMSDPRPQGLTTGQTQADKQEPVMCSGAEPAKIGEVKVLGD
jgi:hypothetical protein